MDCQYGFNAVEVSIRLSSPCVSYGEQSNTKYCPIWGTIYQSLRQRDNEEDSINKYVEACSDCQPPQVVDNHCKL